MKDYKIRKLKYLEAEKRVFDLEMQDEYFDDVKGVKLNKNFCLKECNLLRKDWCDRKAVFTFDCEVRRQKLLSFYYSINAFIVVTTVFLLFKNSPLNFLGNLGVLVLILVAFECLCSLIEDNAFNFYKKYIYWRLKKHKERQEKSKKQKEQENEGKRIEKIANTPNGQEIFKAETIVKRFKAISEQYNFGLNEKKINKCVKKSEEILAKIQDTPENYARVAYLFDAYLPEFCNTLTFFGKFIEAKTVTEDQEKTLSECVNVMLEFLDDQKVQAVFDKETVEIQFDASAKALKHMIEKEIKK